jgi:aminoglycoside phosphotransferase (APT) family kinase protein
VVLSHNDINPSNLVYDGARLMLVDWDMAGPNDRYYDLGTASLFFRMDGPACCQLLSAYEATPVTRVPPGFSYNRRLAAALCGVMFLHLARVNGHPGASGNETLDTTPTLVEFYQQLRAGAVKIGSADGNWAFALALVKEGLA